MITKTDKIMFSSFGLIIVLLFVFSTSLKSFQKIGKDEDGMQFKATREMKSSNVENENDDGTRSEVRIVNKWDLPSELKEVSGIAYLDDQRFACVQDEEGTIFIFNTQSNSIEKKISFAGPGDYEDIAVIGDMAYILRADGKIFETDIKGSKSEAKEYSTKLTVKHNVEGLCYDKKNNRLLLAIKDDEPNSKDYKGIYAFDLSKKSFVEEPVYKIDLKNEIVIAANKDEKKKKKNKSIRPSAIGIHPKTNEILVVDGTRSQLLIMDASGNIKRMVVLGNEFAQPEGLTFNANGTVYISNEGTKEAGNILEVELP